MATPTSGAAWLTRPTLNSTESKSLLVEIDQDFLAQIRRIVPAGLAGYCLWTGTAIDSKRSEVWVKWHWYFDEQLKQFVVPLHGISSNVVLIEQNGRALSDEALARHVHRRLRRRHDWRPWFKLHESRLHSRSALTSLGAKVLRPTQRPSPAAHDPPSVARAKALEKWDPDEVEIIRLLRIGQKRKQIAANLNMSTATLDRRIGGIRQRLNVNSIPALIEAAIRLRLI